MRAAVSGIPNPYVSLIVVRTGEGSIPVDAARDFGSIGGIELDAALGPRCHSDEAIDQQRILPHSIR